MRTFREIADRHLRIGTSIAIVGGLLLGLTLGARLVSLENSSLLFPTTGARFAIVAFIASFCALLAAGLFVPLELGMAGLATIRADVAKVPPKPFYASAFVIGVLSVHALLSLTFNIVRNITSAKGLTLSALIVVMALALLLIVIRLWPRREARDESGPRAVWVVGLLASCLGVCLVSHHNLRLAANLSLSTTDLSIRKPSSAVPASAAATGPNVILISIDTLRSDHLSSYGYPRQTTPHIDGLAADGTLFLNARSQAPWTLPSHASMLTSLYPSSHGVRFGSVSNFELLKSVADRLSDSTVTLAELLHTAGMRTGAFTSMVWLSPAFGFDQGFDHFEVAEEANRATKLVDHATAWAGNDRERPFFMFLHFYEVHEYNPPAAYETRYRDPDYNGRLEHDAHFKRDLMSSFYEDLPEPDRRYVIAKYDASLSYVDFELGRLFAWLRQTNQYDDTLVIVTADHGDEFWDHGGTGHGFTLYDEQLRVPLVIKTPGTTGRQAPRVRDANVGVIDVMPTILAFVGMPAPPFLQGVSLRPLIESDQAPPARSLFAEDTVLFNSYAKIENNIKYVENRVPPFDLLNAGLLFANVRSFYRFRENEMFRLDTDPDEMSNVLSGEPDTASRMRAELLDHISHPVDRTQMHIGDDTLERLRSLGYVK